MFLLICPITSSVMYLLQRGEKREMAYRKEPCHKQHSRNRENESLYNPQGPQIMILYLLRNIRRALAENRGRLCYDFISACALGFNAAMKLNRVNSVDYNNI